MIPEWLSKNFNTLKQAFQNNDVALVECIDKFDKKPVYTICAVNRINKEIELIPFAIMPHEQSLVEIVDPPVEIERQK